MAEYTDANGQPIELGRVYWDNNLDLVRVVKIADWPADAGGNGDPWHETERLSDGRMSHSDSGRFGRLATFHPVSRLDATRAAALGSADPG